MRPSLTTLFSCLLAAFLAGACSLFESPKHDDNDDADLDPVNMEMYADQSQNAVIEIWGKAMAQSTNATGGRVESVAVESDSLTEVCGLRATMDLTQVRPVLTVNFTSFRCEFNNIVREGQLTMEVLKGTGIEKKNSVTKFSFIDFKVINVETGKYVVYNGDIIVTNLSGGTLPDLSANQPELVHRVRSYDFHVFYSGSGGDIVRNTARFKKFSKLDVGNNYEMITYGDTTINGVANVANWGTMRNGKFFYHIIERPIFYESCMKKCKYVSGRRIQRTVGGRETFTNFGVDKSGQPMETCNAFGKLMYYFDAHGDSIPTLVKYN
jgi:hypothetical protein